MPKEMNVMNQKEQELLAGVAEMRSVADKLLRWADRLEKSVQENRTEVTVDAKPDVPPVAVPEPAPAAVPAPAPAAEPVTAPAAAENEPMSFETLRGALAFICASGYTEQVKGLITGYGAARLNQVPEAKWQELLTRAKGLVK